MKIFKIGQNIEYLSNIGVPESYRQEILDYLMSLDKETRKVILRKIRQNPSMSMHQIRELETDTKKDYLRGQGYPENIIDIASNISPKYAVWLSREIKRHRDEGKKNYKDFVNFWEDMNDKYNTRNGDEAWDKMTPEERKQEDILRHHTMKIDPRIADDTAPWKSTLMNPESKPISQIIDYFKQHNPDIMSMSYSDALKASNEWHEELAMRAEEEQISSYKSNNVKYDLDNGWKIVELEPGDCEVEGDLMGHCVGTYSREVEEGKTQIFSLRDTQNNPHATIEMSIYNNALQGFYNNKETTPKKEELRAQVRQIQGKGNDEPIDEYKEMIKQWFNKLKSDGIKFDPMEDQYGYNDYSGIKQIEDAASKEDDYGIPVSVSGVGGDEVTYYENLLEAYNEGWGGNWWYKSRSTNLVDNIIDYSIQKGELDTLEKAITGFSSKVNNNGKTLETYNSIDDWANDLWFDNEQYIETDTPRPDEDDYPNKEDFMIQPDSSQMTLNGIPSPVPVLDEEAYNEAVQEFKKQEESYNEEIRSYEQNFEAFEFRSYVDDAIKEAKQRVNPEEQRNTEEQEPVTASNSNMKTRIYKMAKKEKLSAEESAEYVKALKMYSDDNPSMDSTYANLIKGLPSARKIRQDFSEEECKILYETIDFLWKKLTGDHIIKDEEIITAPETLFGNYWLMKNGIILKGVNHFSIIKNNTSLICTLLNINGMTLQEYLCSKPEKLIGFIIKNGGVRVLVNSNKKLYAQMSAKTYGQWGKSKIKKYDFGFKAVKVIDFKRPYEGWKSGITIKL